MFALGGRAYVYLCYGIHELLNVVTNVAGIPHAVLIRGIFPTLGLEEQLKNRKATLYKKGLMNGPGKVSQALGINRTHNNHSLLSQNLGIYKGIMVQDTFIQSGPRIGIDYALEWKDKPWRFWLEEKHWNV
jgi:DNA-3-methyladenine glycosylase